MRPARDAARGSRVVLLTGLSGSGKSTAAKVFEDLGYFCVDNTPPVLLPRIIDLVSEARGEGVKIALVADVRGREFLPDFARVIGDLRRQGHGVRVLFLDADDEVLMRRFSETRRKHPLGARVGAKEAIRRERKVLNPLREMADTVLNTTQFTVHQLGTIFCAATGCRTRRDWASASSPSATGTGSPWKRTWLWTSGSCPTPTSSRASNISPGWTGRSGGTSSRHRPRRSSSG